MEYTIIGYKFDTQGEADAIVAQLNQHYGIPQSPDDTTQYYAIYHKASLNNPVFYYFIGHEGLVPVLGEPYEFVVNFAD